LWNQLAIYGSGIESPIKIPSNILISVFFGEKYTFIILEINETKMWIVYLCPAFADFKYFI
jgi:hypothetical protein